MESTQVVGKLIQVLESSCSLRRQHFIIKALGRTKNPFALKYMKDLVQNKTTTNYSEGGSNNYADHGTITYPNAKGPLADALHHTWTGGMAAVEPTSPDKKSLRVMNRALSRLERQAELCCDSPNPSYESGTITRWCHTDNYKCTNCGGSFSEETPTGQLAS